MRRLSDELWTVIFVIGMIILTIIVIVGLLMEGNWP